MHHAATPPAPPTLPVIDVGEWEQAGAVKRARIREKVLPIFRDVGFFYVRNHGIDPALLSDAQSAARAFFALPQADKDALAMVNSPHFRGYTRAGLEITRGAADWREQFDIGAERPVIDPIPADQPWLRTQGPNQWPSSLPSLQPLLRRYQTALSGLSVRLLHLIAETLGLPAQAFDPLWRDSPRQSLKLIRYPGSPDATASAQGVGPHKDSDMLSLIYQDDVGGLEAEVGEAWIAARPIPGTFVVNFGEALELATNGYLRGTYHRVVSPPPGVERLSQSFFFGARLDAVIEPLHLPEGLQALATGPARDPLNPLLHAVGPNYLKGRLRSHTDVAARHYADIVGTGPAAAPAGY